MSKDNFFDDSCCNNHCCDSSNNNLDISCFWTILIILIFRGIPIGNDCFWNGYCNAFNSSAFSCGNHNNINNNSLNFNNNSNLSFNNSNTNSFFSGN